MVREERITQELLTSALVSLLMGHHCSWSLKAASSGGLDFLGSQSSAVVLTLAAGVTVAAPQSIFPLCLDGWLDGWMDGWWWWWFFLLSQPQNPDIYVVKGLLIPK